MNNKLLPSMVKLEFSVKYNFLKTLIVMRQATFALVSDSSLVVGGSLYIQYSTSEFYFWQRVNVRVFWEVCAQLDTCDTG